MDVYLLNPGPEPAAGRPVFYAEPPGDEGEAAPAHKGLRGWAEVRFRRVKAGWQHSQGRAARVGRRVWDWLHRRTHPDEAMLSRLRSAKMVEIHHPASMSPEEARAAWSALLARSRRRHWPWFLVNALVAPLTVVLAPLPGPNLVGYWFAYRALHHGLILAGLGRTRKGRVETRLRPNALLDRPVAPGGPGRGPGTAHLAALGCDPEAVGAFLRRHGVPAAGEAEAAPVGPADGG